MNLKKMFASAFCAALLFSLAAGIPAMAEGTPSVLYAGDVNLDGTVDVTDAVLLQKHLLGRSHLPDPAAVSAADLNGDGAVDVFDLGLLKQKLLTDVQVREDGDFIPAPLKNFYGSLPSQGSGRMAVFYVDFPDCKFDYEPNVEEINKICFGYNNDTSDPNYPFTSLRSFLFRSSKGVFDLNGKAFRYTAKHPIADYGGDDEKVKLMTEIVQYHNRFVDFASFDGDKDGIIDSMLICVPKTAPENDWWPASGQNYSNLEADGVKIGHVTTGLMTIDSAAEHRNFVSLYAHETGHNMGLPDYYLLHSEDIEGFHGEAGTALMDVDQYSDFCCFSKLMLGWYREKQVMVYDTAKGGEQTFELRNAQTLSGNCLILPCGTLDSNYNSEYMILEFNTDQQNNSGVNRDKTELYGYQVTSGVRAFHVQAAAEDRGNFRWLTYRATGGSEKKSDDGIRLIRLVNDAEGGKVFKSGDVIDGKISGFHWYAPDETESVDTGYTVKIGACNGGSYTITVTK